MASYSQEEVDKNEILTNIAPWLLLLLLMEFALCQLKKKRAYRLNDTINSLSHGVTEQLFLSLTSKSVEYGAYLYVYNRFSLFEISQDSIWAWIACLVGVDFGYYWFHRAAHEINLFWASHSVHHSSEDYNLSTALRQSAVQVHISWLFYMPLAFFLPPPLFYFHKQVNALYQFYIHTQLINKMGFLEYILNTPSHHRVHHGRNPKYIDKNYAGIFIIWDRMFGTFQEEIEEPVYGLVHPLQTWSIIEGQTAHFKYIAKRIKEERTWKNKLASIWKGPGWEDGKPRLGILSDIPEVDAKTIQKYDPQISTLDALYVLIHFLLVSILSVYLMLHKFESYVLQTLITVIMIGSLTTFGAILDKKSYAYRMELGRIIILTIAEVLCWMAFKDEFVFLWYNDPFLQYIPLTLIKMCRGIFIASGLLMVIKSGIFSSPKPDNTRHEGVSKGATEAMISLGKSILSKENEMITKGMKLIIEKGKKYMEKEEIKLESPAKSHSNIGQYGDSVMMNEVREHVRYDPKIEKVTNEMEDEKLKMSRINNRISQDYQHNDYTLNHYMKENQPNQRAKIHQPLNLEMKRHKQEMRLEKRNKDPKKIKHD